MIDLPTTAALKAASETTAQPELRKLLSDRLADTVSCGLEKLTHMLVIEAGDREAEVVEAIGFSPLKSRIDGKRCQPDWDWIDYQSGWWELIYTVGNSGFAYILLVEDDPRSLFAQLCRNEARR